MSKKNWLTGTLAAVLGAVGITKRVMGAANTIGVLKKRADGSYEEVVLRFLQESGCAKLAAIRTEVKARMSTLKTSSVEVTDQVLTSLLAKGEIYRKDQRNSARSSTRFTPFYYITNKGRVRLGIPVIPQEDEDALINNN